MYRIISETRQDVDGDEGYQDVLRALQGLDPTSRHLIVKLSPESTTGDWMWLSDLRHDIHGAIRSFQYLAHKSKAAYDPKDPRGRKIIESIDRHLALMETLKRDLLDEIFEDQSPN